MNDNVNHPTHYTNRGIECIQVTEMFNFNRGNAIKYIWRAGEKSKDTEIEDLRKAIWYLEREIKGLMQLSHNGKRVMQDKAISCDKDSADED